MNIQQLRYVVATAEHGSMTAAATALYVAQPALSRAVRLLERELGSTLFARAGRGVALTAAGEAFVSRARKALRSLDALVGMGERDQAGPLVIAASPTLQASMVVPLLAALHNQGALVHARLLGCSGTTEVHAYVEAGRADLGICDQTIPTALTTVLLGNAEVKLYSPPGLELPETIPLSALGDVPLVLPTAGTDRRVALDRFFEGCGVVPAVAIESDERSVWLEAVLLGVASCLWHSVESLRVPHGVIVARSFDPPMHQELSVVHREDDAGEAKLLLLDLLRELAELAPEVG